ncbi:hypothetical protein F4677DRAFT_407911 [Hypoxylon crocopeplum]|nr:hypothetical protein F4677DRAFT_407911 [Hypoxylon crocopeplum]
MVKYGVVASSFQTVNSSNQPRIVTKSTMNIFILSVSVALFMSTVIGWDPSQRDCSGAPLCLTSFKWCDPNGAGCYFPNGAYSSSATPRQSVYALLVESRNFTISWKLDIKNKDTPVRVRWALAANSTWETNTTDSQIIFNPRDILSSFPLPSAPNLSAAEAEYNAIKDVSNTISISQPGIQNEEESSSSATNAPFDVSDQFVVATGIEAFLKAQNELGHRDEYGKWRLGVGIGVGLGAPILMIVTVLITGIVVRKRMAKSPVAHNKPIEMSPGPRE